MRPPLEVGAGIGIDLPVTSLRPMLWVGSFELQNPEKVRGRLAPRSPEVFPNNEYPPKKNKESKVKSRSLNPKNFGVAPSLLTSNQILEDLKTLGDFG